MDADDQKKASADSDSKKRRFDPFNDRLSRDIRNHLSETFVESLAHLNRQACQDAAARWAPGSLPAKYRAYIRKRLQRYQRVFKQIQKQQLSDAHLRALVIWNHGLFFEFHDHLEGIWRYSAGDERQALKGLIKAAGVYIHKEFNHQRAAERLAAKSISLLSQYSQCLSFIANLNVLIEKLRNLDPVPPQLENSEIGPNRKTD